MSGAFDGVDFIDLGASTGGSLRYCAQRFGGTGVGVDVDEAKVAAARASGQRVIHADARRLELTGAVRYVAAIDFLEHLPDVAAAAEIIASAARAATDFLYIRHPSFEGESALRALGLCQYWQNWSGHPNHMRVSDYCETFQELGLRRYFIRYVERIEHSSHPSILPVTAGRNQHEYDPGRHGPKPEIGLTEPVWRLQEIFVALRDFKAREWAGIVDGP